MQRRYGKSVRLVAEAIAVFAHQSFRSDSGSTIGGVCSGVSARAGGCSPPYRCPRPPPKVCHLAVPGEAPIGLERL